MIVYWTSIEFKYKNSSEKLIGGFVYAFTIATDARNALDLFLIEFEKKELQIFFIEHVSPYDEEIKWETKTQTDHYMSLFREAIKQNCVIFDDFYSYEDEN